MPLSLHAILEKLRLSGEQFLATFQGIPDPDWRQKPHPDAWSMAEVAEHIAIIEAQVRQLVIERMSAAPAPAELLQATAGKDEVIDRSMADLHRRSAPELTMPKGRWASAEELSQSFRDNRERLIEFMRTTTIDADTHAWEHLAFGPLTLRQWLFFQCRHVERHTLQMLALRRGGV
jgi:hypothetical protein